MRGSKCHLKWAIIGPPARWRSDNGPHLNVGLEAFGVLVDLDQYC